MAQDADRFPFLQELSLLLQQVAHGSDLTTVRAVQRVPLRDDAHLATQHVHVLAATRAVLISLAFTVIAEAAVHFDATGVFLEVPSFGFTVAYWR